MIDLAKEQDLDALKEIWRQCFGGSEAYLTFYYNNRFEPDDTIIWRENGIPVSMMTLMEVAVDGQKGYYVYAVATLPLHQKRGLMRKMDEGAVKIMRERGASFSCLVPAEPPLFYMYQKLGYETCFFHYKAEIEAEQPPMSERFFFPCGFGKFKTMRSQYHAEVAHGVTHPDEELRYIYDELKRFSGNVLAFFEEGKLCYVAYNDLTEGILLRETSSKEPIAVAGSLMRRHNRLKATVCGRAPFPGGVQCAFGMGRRFADEGTTPMFPEDESGGYMSLMLD